MTAPLVFDIARGSFSDGPGVRTVVFLKGCPLRCVWCQNPESQRTEQEIFTFPERCIGCGDCDRDLECIAKARRPVGRYLSPNELAETILQDKPYFDTSNGGVTFSGGEPLLFVSYLREVLVMLKAAGIHAAIETSGHFDGDAFETHLARYVDLVYYDLKIYDSDAHVKYTGRSNRLILENLRRLLDLGLHVVPRIPLIPGHTATEENLFGLADHLADLRLTEVEFLFYNPGGQDKLARLGREAPHDAVLERLSTDEQQRLIRLFERRFGDKSLNPQQ
jgi:pyruvate formate lyase activating enzyme